MSGRSRGQREAFEASTDGEARIIIDSPEDIQQELNRLTFEPRRSSSPDPPEVGPDLIAVSLQHTAERDEARRERDEQVALRDEEREAANAAFKAADAERETHLATIREKDREIASLKARLRGAAVSDENVESEVEDPNDFQCVTDPSATAHAGKKIAFACCEADTCTRMDEDGQCLAGDLRSLSNFAPKDWHEATNVCAAEGKVLCGVDKPCSGSGCSYDFHYQWTGEECQAGDAGLPAAC